MTTDMVRSVVISGNYGDYNVKMQIISSSCVLFCVCYIMSFAKNFCEKESPTFDSFVHQDKRESDK